MENNNITPYFENKGGRLYLGACLDVLKRIPDSSVHCVVTSPPYYNLRDYETGVWEGGDPNCNHFRDTKITDECATGHKSMQHVGVADGIYKSVCKKCGAKRVDRQVGIEETPQEYIDNIVSIFNEVRRVLRPDGSLWFNIGDTYANSTSEGNKVFGNPDFNGGTARERTKTPAKKLAQGYKPKDLMMIPARTAIALQESGWWLRQDIIWCLSGDTFVFARIDGEMCNVKIRDLYLEHNINKKEAYLYNGDKWTKVLGVSCSDIKGTDTRCVEVIFECGFSIRCTDNHEFPTRRGLCPAGELVRGDTILSCQLPSSHLDDHTTSYRVAAVIDTDVDAVFDIGVEDEPHLFALSNGMLTHNSKPNPLPESCVDRCTKSHEYIYLLAKSEKYFFDYQAIEEEAVGQSGRKRVFGAKQQVGTFRQDVGRTFEDNGRRRKRSVWQVNVRPFKEAHFATFPTDLIEPAIMAGCPEQVCKKCQTPREKIIENGEVVGWKECDCNAGFEGGVVLDPFFGSGTTGVVAESLGRRWLGIDLNESYCEIAIKRVSQARHDYLTFNG